jgi:hypothetical protein
MNQSVQERSSGSIDCIHFDDLLCCIAWLATGPIVLALQASIDVPVVAHADISPRHDSEPSVVLSKIELILDSDGSFGACVGG